ncbi:MAG: hypothetical protein KGL39_45560 [Patescibacteria group bacterium]|nr:hypothetical protein [Patescibacteria group bacterium]
MSPQIAHVAHASAPIDYDRLLWAIRQVEECPGRPIGKHGERGPWQIKYAVWRETTDRPFSEAFTPEIAREVAAKRLRNLRTALLTRHLPLTVRNLALMWNAGAYAVICHRIQPQHVKDYAERVENLYAGVRGY